MKKVVVLAGPTASGKTSLSISLAKKLGMEIINGDSVAIHKMLDIGSAKITEEEMNGIPHHLLDVVMPNESYSVFEYQRDVRKLIDKIDTPLIVGGSGFYIKSALYNYHFEEEEKVLIDNLSINEMLKVIKLSDPEFEFDDKNPRRVQRAYQQIRNLEKPSNKTDKDTPLYDILILYLDMPRKLQRSLMIKRVDKQIEDGFIKEVQMLRDNGYYINNIIGYRELNLYLDNEITLEEAKEKIVTVSYQYSKRQKTWFLNQMNPVLIDPLSPTLVIDALKTIKEFLEKV